MTEDKGLNHAMTNRKDMSRNWIDPIILCIFA